MTIPTILHPKTTTMSANPIGQVLPVSLPEIILNLQKLRADLYEERTPRRYLARIDHQINLLRNYHTAAYPHHEDQPDPPV